MRSVCVCGCVCLCIFDLHVSVNNTPNIWVKYALALGALSFVVFTLFSALAATNGGAGWLNGVRFLEGIGEGSTFPALKLSKNQTWNEA